MASKVTAENDMEDILGEVKTERIRQDNKWGEQNHDLNVWLTVLMEEVGEVARNILEARFMAKDGMPGAFELYIQDLRKELIEVAAVAVATVEYIDRGEPKA